MKARHDWHRTQLGRLTLFFGSIRFAVPVLAITAIALITGTLIEVTAGAPEAGRLVYGSWWFIGLMAVVCAILVIAVITRFPWRRKHTGFIVVHAALIMIIVSAFVSYFTKVEGEIALQEGSGAQAIRTGKSQIQLLEHGSGDLIPVADAVVQGPGTHALAGLQVEILEQWENSALKTAVLDDGLNKLHAVELRFEGDTDEGYWIGQLAEGQQPPVLAGMDIRVLSEGDTWDPPAPGATIALELRNPESGEAVAEIDPGTALSDGWTIDQVQVFAHALVGQDGLSEGESTRDNPATQVSLVNTDGSVERHAAFERFTGTINKRTISGESVSNYLLTYVGETLDRPVLSFTRDSGVTSVKYAAPDGASLGHTLEGEGPWVVDLAGQTCEILHAFGNARAAEQRVEAPRAEESVPVLVVRVTDSASPSPDTSDPITLVWGQPVLFHAQDRPLGLVFSPQTRPLPFSIDLVEFRKQDYPGSDQAMAYESDVVFTPESGESHEQTIWMNNPLEHRGWKVYQAGFVGADVSIFQVTRDPGLIPMYLGCALLCAGILVMNYSRAYSHGHPGMARDPRKRGKATHHESAQDHPVPAAGDASEQHRERSPEGRRELEVTVCADPDPRPRAHHAHGHLRASRRGRSDRTNSLG